MLGERKQPVQHDEAEMIVDHRRSASSNRHLTADLSRTPHRTDSAAMTQRLDDTPAGDGIYLCRPAGTQRCVPSSIFEPE